MRREVLVTENPSHEAVTIHAQQCLEKLIKANCKHLKISFPYIHELGELLDLLIPIYPDLAQDREECVQLSVAAIEVRYPGDTTSAEEARWAANLCERVRAKLIAKLPID